MIRASIYFAIVAIAAIVLGFNIYKSVKSSTVAASQSKSDENKQ